MAMIATDLAYLAGILDGEGSFVANIHPTKHTNGKYYRCTNACAQCAMTSYEPIELLFKTFGGCIHKVKRLTKGGRQAWLWSLNSQQLVDALPMFLPYLRIKRKQAELVGELAQLKLNNVARGQRALTIEEWAFREAICAQVRELNA